MLLLNQFVFFSGRMVWSTSLKTRNSLYHMVKWSSPLMCESQSDPTSLYTRQLQQKGTSVLNDDSHPLHSEFQVLPSGRRFLIPRCKTKRYKNSFVPTVLNKL